MALIRNIVKSILPPEDTAEMWLDGEGKLRAYTLGVWKEVSATEVNSEEVIAASQGYPYNVPTFQIEGYNVDFKSKIFEGDLMIAYHFMSSTTDLRLFDEDSFLANHVKKINIMGKDVEDMASLPSILTMIKATYKGTIQVIFTLDTDTIEGELFGIDYNNESTVPNIEQISVNCKVKTLDLSHASNSFMIVSLLNSPTEILEHGSIKGNFFYFILPLALKNLEEGAFAKFTNMGSKKNSQAMYLFMPSLTVPESLPQSLSIINDEKAVYFPALVGERTYKDYVADVFNIDVTTEAGAANVYCFDVATGSQVTFKSQS